MADCCGGQQVDLIREQAGTAFEDELSREYRSLLDLLPPEAFYADSETFEPAPHRAAFYRYFDLSNDQLFLARQGRITPATRAQWEDGIEGNLRLPAFQAAWADVVEHLPAGFFEDLRTLRRQRKIPGPPLELTQWRPERTPSTSRNEPPSRARTTSARPRS